jgi:hypothetical protein
MEQINTEVSKSNTFLSHMFSFDNDTKNELLNIGQYAIISIVPLLALVKLIDGVLPNFDPSKGNIELVGEILVHLTLLIAAVFFVDRLVKFVPTYSGKGHASINFLNIVIMFYLTSEKMGEKIVELSKRVDDMWNGNLKPVEGKEKKDSKVSVSQPIKQVQRAAPTHQASRADYLNTHNQMTATENQQNEVMGQAQQQQEAGHGAGNDMYNSMGFAGPQDMGMMEPIAANSALGGFTSF